MNLFRRILVPHDFSEHAARALAVAAELAGRDGRIVVLHVVTPFHPVTGLPEEGMMWAPETDVLGAEERRLVAVVRKTLGTRGAARAECRVAIGDPYHRIVDAARRVDAIVMSTAGRTGFARLLIGSVAEKVVRHAPVPVLTLPARTRRRRRRGRGRAAR